MSHFAFDFEFTRPVWLAVLAVLPLVAWYAYRSLVDFARPQRLTSFIVRALVLVLLALSLAGLTWQQTTTDRCFVVAIDRSRSVSSDLTTTEAAKVDSQPAVTEQFLAELAAAQPAAGDRFLFVEFASQPGPLTSQPPAGPAPDAGQPPEQPARDWENGTDLAAALRAATAGLPPDYVPEVVLLSDGNQTRGDALQVALTAAVTGRPDERIPISTIPLPVRTDPEVQVSRVQTPAQVREGEPFHVEVTIDSNHADETLVEVYRGAHKVLSETKALKDGENRFRFMQSVTGERLAEYSVRISGAKQDTLLDNNTATSLVFTAGKPRVLLIEADPQLAQNLVWALQQEGIETDVRPPEGLPESLSDLQNYELVALSNIPATSLTQNQMNLMRTYVQDLGGGLMMLGGDQSFGLGGYYKTVIEEILPVRSDFEREKEKPSLGMVLVIDKSGSMGGDKIEMAKEAAKSAAELLAPRDQLGVLAFDGELYWVSELQSASNKSAIISDISRIEAGGGTNMYPPMEEAFNVLQAAVAKLKHVIVLTDGVSAPGDFEGLAQRMASARITCSTVSVGEGSDDSLLERIAEAGQGRFFHANDPQSLPQIFAKETMTASKSALNELPFLPQVVRPTQALADIDFASAPFLLGYVMTRPKPTSELILASEQGDPVLAWWRYGLGTTVAFTSDAHSRWGAEWLSWPGYGKFWAQVIRYAMRKNDVKGLQWDVTQSGGTATVTVDAIDDSGRFLNQAGTELTILDPGAGSQPLTLAQTAPGRYQASFPTEKKGAYHLHLVQKTAGGTLLHQQSRGLTVGYPEELRLRSTNKALLQELATATGGRFQPSVAELLAPQVASGSAGDPPLRTASRPVPLWPWLVALAAILFVLDVALRRIDFSLYWGTWRPRQTAMS